MPESDQRGSDPERSLPEPYTPTLLEPKWQERWREGRVFESDRSPGRPKYFCYNPAPYVTGALHMGHVRNYTCGDFIAKLMKLRGRAVLYTIGFDAYGLPTEMAAIRNALDPDRWTADCLASMKRQLVAMGFGFDWRRSFLTSEPEYYRWTQWIFLQLYGKGLIYSSVGTTYWCPQCETALARTQVEDGRCWICGSAVGRRNVREWRLKLTAYLTDLLSGLDEMRDLNGLADRGQRNLICPQTGVRVELRVADGERIIGAYMSGREDWRFPCVLAIDARDERTLGSLPGVRPAAPESEPAFDGTAIAPGPFLEALRAALPDATLTGLSVVEVCSGRTLPVVIAAGMDTAFSDQPVVVPLCEGDGQGAEPETPEFPPLTIYRQKDFSVSRQRFWGTPIPIVFCDACGEVPVPLSELPVEAPKVVFDPANRRLKREDPEWGRRPCPRCGKAAVLDDQVMDCHMDSIWHPFRPCAGGSRDFLFDPAEVEYWMPADIIQFGRDVIPFMLDLRFFSHFLERLGYTRFREFCRDVLAHGLILHEGRKMSKHLGNAVTPEEVVQEFGADSLRFYVLAHAEPRSDFRWSDEGIRRYHTALSRFYEIILEEARQGEPGPPTPAAAPNRTFTRFTNVFLKKIARDVAVLESSVDDGRYDRYAGALARLLDSIDFFSANHRARETDPRFTEFWRHFLEDSVVYLAPVAPHLAEECWELLGRPGPLFAHARFPEGQAETLAGVLAQGQGGR